MVQINFTDKEMLTKVVYYGPGLCGKTTNLQVIHRLTDPDQNTKLFSINTEQDRTLFFDLLPLNVGKISGYSIKIQIYTVPGQVHYASTRRAVLAGADAIVFVADSNPKAMKYNLLSIRDLHENMNFHGLDPNATPVVIQYNKRDLPEVMTLEQLDTELNPRKVPSFESIAIKGQGVLDTFIGVARLMVNHIVQKYRLGHGQKVDFGEKVAEALNAYRGNKGKDDTQPIDLSSLKMKFDFPPDKREYEPPDTSAETGEMPIIREGAPKLTDDELVERAVSANMEMAQINIQLEETKKALSERVQQLEAVNRVGETVTSVLDIDRLLIMIGKALGEHRKDCVCISLVEGRPPELKPRTSYLLKTDPIFTVRADKGKSLAHLLAAQRRPTIVSESKNETWFQLVKAKYPNIQGIISFPLLSHRRLLGLVNVITTNPQRRFNEIDLSFYTATGQFLSSAIENAGLYSMVTRLNRTLERKVGEYNELKDAFDTMVRERTNDFAQANRELTKTTQEILEMDQVKDKFMKLIGQEIQVPITMIADALAEVSDAVNDPDARGKLVKAMEQANTLTDTLSSLTDLLNLEQGKIEFHWVEANLADCIRKAIRGNTSLIRNKTISILTRLDAKVQVRMDVDWMKRAIGALVHNAVWASPTGSKIKIWSDFHKNAVLIYFRDYGRGIANKDQVFNKFQIIEGSEYCDEGLGLGLPIAREVAEAHNGFLEVLDPPKNKTGEMTGSLFRLSLPCSNKR